MCHEKTHFLTTLRVPPIRLVRIGGTDGGLINYSTKDGFHPIRLARIGGSDQAARFLEIMASQRKLIHHPHEADGVLLGKYSGISGPPSCPPIQASWMGSQVRKSAYVDTIGREAEESRSVTPFAPVFVCKPWLIRHRAGRGQIAVLFVLRNNHPHSHALRSSHFAFIVRRERRPIWGQIGLH